MIFRFSFSQMQEELFGKYMKLQHFKNVIIFHYFYIFFSQKERNFLVVFGSSEIVLRKLFLGVHAGCFFVCLLSCDRLVICSGCTLPLP